MKKYKKKYIYSWFLLVGLLYLFFLTVSLFHGISFFPFFLTTLFYLWSVGENVTFIWFPCSFSIFPGYCFWKISKVKWCNQWLTIETISKVEFSYSIAPHILTLEVAAILVGDMLDYKSFTPLTVSRIIIMAFWLSRFLKSFIFLRVTNDDKISISIKYIFIKEVDKL